MNLALQATASAAEQMQIETEEAMQGAIPETQATEFSAPESLMAGMRGHAARMETDTVQSSATLKNESVPRNQMESKSATLNPGTTTEKALLSEQEAESANQVNEIS